MSTERSSTASAAHETRPLRCRWDPRRQHRPLMKLVLFDVDGTLVDSQNIIVAAQRAAFEAHGLEPPSRERSLSIVGITLVQAFAAMAGPKAPVESLAEAYRGPSPSCAGTRPMPNRSIRVP